MLEKLVCSMWAARMARYILNFALAKLLLVPLVAQVPGLGAFLANPDLASWAAGGLAAAVCGLIKKLRADGKIPKWLPL